MHPPSFPHTRARSARPGSARLRPSPRFHEIECITLWSRGFICHDSSRRIPFFAIRVEKGKWTLESRGERGRDWKLFLFLFFFLLPSFIFLFFFFGSFLVVFNFLSDWSRIRVRDERWIYCQGMTVEIELEFIDPWIVWINKQCFALREGFDLYFYYFIKTKSLKSRAR